MTLTKAIEAAEKAVNELDFTDKSTVMISHELRMSLAALPDKPMTEQEITKIILSCIREGKYNDVGMSVNIFQKLKAANVLYVEEG